MLKVKALFGGLAAALLLSACSGGNQVASVQKGAVALNLVRVGTPEVVFREGIMTFVQDPNGSMGGKTQYLSRITDDHGGQYVVQAKNDQCYEVDIVQHQPLDKDTAVKTMERLLPPEVVASAKPTVSVDKKQPIETYTWGKDYRGQLVLDKSRKEVKTISAARVAGSV